MSTIPFDPSLVLGNLVDLTRIERLKKLAELEQPQTLAEQKLNHLTLASYKMKMIQRQMKGMQGIPAKTLTSLENQLTALISQTGEAAVALAVATIEGATAVNAFLLEESQVQIDDEIESPIDYGLSPIKNFPLSSDTLDFDVQYFKNDGNKDDNSGHISQVSDFIAGQTTTGQEVLDVPEDGTGETTPTPGKTSDGILNQVSKTMTAQTSKHSIEGTIVIVANCTHRSADIIAPVVLDPKKALEAWNASFPDDPLDTDPKSMFDAACPKYKSKEDAIKRRKEESAMCLLSGCTRGSSFVGMVHILKIEETSTTQDSSSTTAAMKRMVESDLQLQQMSGNYGVSSNLSSNMSSLLSSSSIQNHCSLITRGIIPNIAANNMDSVVQSLRPDATKIMENMGAIAKAGEQSAGQMAQSTAEAGGTQAKAGAQYQQLDSSFAASTVSNMTALQLQQNKVIDTNSMMTAFTDYINKATAGGCGVPINFYIKRIPKREVACCYINKYYPNGSAATQKDARMGQLGAEQ